MIKAERKDIPTIIDILAPAFDTNWSVNRSVKQDAKRLQRIRNQIRYICKISIRNQMAFINKDKTCAVLCNLSDGKRATVIDDLYFLFKVSGFLLGLQLMRREKLIKQFHPDGVSCHLWFIGVAKEAQGQGIGSLMLDEIKRLCQQMNLSIYLETSNKANIKFYESNGFELYQTTRLPMDSFDLYFYRWSPWK